MTIAKGPIAIAADIAAGRLAAGDPTESLIENVKVWCRACGGITVFPVLKHGGIRPTPAPCCHCGAAALKNLASATRKMLPPDAVESGRCCHCGLTQKEHVRNEKVGGGDLWLICPFQATDVMVDMTRYEAVAGDD